MASIFLPSLSYSYYTYGYKGNVHNTVTTDTDNRIDNASAQGLADEVCLTWHEILRKRNTTTLYYTTGSGSIVQRGDEHYVFCEIDVRHWNSTTGWRDLVATNDNPYGHNNGEIVRAYGFCYDTEFKVYEYSHGILSNISYPEVDRRKCLDGCIFEIADQEVHLRVKPEDAQKHGCAFDLEGNVQNCGPFTPVVANLLYNATGNNCPSNFTPDEVALSPPPDEIIDTKEIESELRKLNNNLTDDSSLPDPETISDTAYNDQIEGNITDIGNGTYKPFGSGLSSVFPSFDYSGSCLFKNIDII